MTTPAEQSDRADQREHSIDWLHVVSVGAILLWVLFITPAWVWLLLRWTGHLGGGFCRLCRP